MFNSYFSNSYIDLKNQRRIYVTESLNTLNELMNNQNEEISVHVVSAFGKRNHLKTLKKCDISNYNST